MSSSHTGREAWDPDRCRCPTCGAVQPWQAQCRRCHTELGLLRQTVQEIDLLRRRVFAALEQGDRVRSERLAERLVRLHPTVFHQALLLLAKRKNKDLPGPAVQRIELNRERGPIALLGGDHQSSRSRDLRET